MSRYSNQVKIWIAYTSATWETLYTETYPLLSISERMRFSTIRNLNKKTEYLLSRNLIRHCLKQVHNQQSGWEIVERPQNKPRIVTNLNYSLSHSNGLVCMAFAAFSLGVDIEFMNLKNNMRETAAEFMSAKEYAKFLKLQHPHQSYFYKIWSQKEALYKALPNKKQKHFSFSQTDFSDFICTTNFSSFYTTYKEHFVSVVSEGKIDELSLHIAHFTEEGVFSDITLPTKWQQTLDS